MIAKQRQFCKEIGIKPDVKIKKFPSDLLERKFVIETNIERRHLTPFQKVELAQHLIEIEKKLAEQRKIKGKTLAEKSSKGRATEQVAKKLGISHDTLEHALVVLKEADEENKEKLRRGETKTCSYS